MTYIRYTHDSPPHNISRGGFIHTHLQEIKTTLDIYKRLEALLQELGFPGTPEDVDCDSADHIFSVSFAKTSFLHLHGFLALPMKPGTDESPAFVIYIEFLEKESDNSFQLEYDGGENTFSFTDHLDEDGETEKELREKLFSGISFRNQADRILSESDAIRFIREFVAVMRANMGEEGVSATPAP